jgi:hypothetical protein
VNGDVAGAAFNFFAMSMMRLQSASFLYLELGNFGECLVDGHGETLRTHGNKL